MQLPNNRRIIVEDYPQEQAETIAKLAENLNQFMDDVILLSRNNIDFSNLARSKVVYDVIVDSNQVPTAGNNLIKINLNGYSGKNIIDVLPLQSTNDVVTQTPYLECSYQGNGFVRVSRVLGLPANRKMRVVIEFIK